MYGSATYDPAFESTGQCISMARIRLSELDNPLGKARWDGSGFSASYNDVGLPVRSIQIPASEGGGPATSITGDHQ